MSLVMSSNAMFHPHLAADNEYARPLDYTVMVNRFKLLNLVQELAHQDVMEMIDAVGLEALAYKGASDKWQFMGSGFGQRGEGRRRPFDGDDDEDDGFYFGDEFRRRSVSQGGGRRTSVQAKWTSSRKTDERRPDPSGPPPRPKRTMFRSEKERSEYFSRLANPKSKGKVTAKRGARDASADSPSYAPPSEDFREATGVSRGPEPGVIHRRQISFEDERHPAGSAFQQQGSALDGSVYDDGGRNPPPASSSILHSGGTGFQSRSRGLAPKAKPVGAAVDRTVPMSVIRQAARMVTSDGGGEDALQSPSPHHPPSASSPLPPDAMEARRRAADHAVASSSPVGADAEEDAVEQQSPNEYSSAGGSPSEHVLGDSSVQGGVPSLPQNNDEMIALVESMLQAQEKALHEVVSDLDLNDVSKGKSTRPGNLQTPATGSMRDAATTTLGRSWRRNGQCEEEYLEDALLQESEESEELDEALVFSRMARRLDAMEREIDKVKPDEDDEDELPSGAKLLRSVDAAAAKRRRGAMPEAMRKRLLSARKEAFEYIAYNERQWNTSSVSQFAFAHRLTSMMAEDGFHEVLEEVLTIMDDYVEGLAEHELQ